MVTNSKILVPENFILRLKIFRDGRNQAVGYSNIQLHPSKSTASEKSLIEKIFT